MFSFRVYHSCSLFLHFLGLSFSNARTQACTQMCIKVVGKEVTISTCHHDSEKRFLWGGDWNLVSNEPLWMWHLFARLTLVSVCEREIWWWREREKNSRDKCHAWYRTLPSRVWLQPAWRSKGTSCQQSNRIIAEYPSFFSSKHQTLGGQKASD